MKKIITGILIGFILAMSSTVFAESVKEFILTRASYPIYVGGQEFKNNDLPVLNYEGSTYVPLKAVGDLLKAGVSWNSELRRVEIESSLDSAQEPAPLVDDTSVVNTPIFNPKILNGYLVNSDATAIEYLGVIYLPIRAGSEKYNLDVTWNDASKVLKFNKTDIQAKVNNQYSAAADGFVYNGRSYIRESIFIEASMKVKEYQLNVQLEYLELNKAYISDHGMTVTVKETNVIDKGGFYEYSVTYV
ncbi:stalk domain-containing protein [Paenibacillus sp. strain BS8-2]